VNEQKIQKKIVNFLEAEGHYVVKVVQASKAGVPDILACVNGQFLAIEVKTPETKANVSALQEHNLAKITRSGGLSLVAWELAQVQKFVQKLC
jgi:Holliday junction resolvase